MKAIKLVLWVIFIVSVAGCATVPLTGRKQLVAIPSSEILTLSNDNYKQVLTENKLSANAGYNRMVSEVGTDIRNAVEAYFSGINQSYLLQGYAWEFNVLVSDEMNAWCMPGGKIAFYEGIMPVCQDENGVAVVMSHEIAHAIANHGNERMSQQLAMQLSGVALDVALAREPETTRQIAMLAFGVGGTVGVLLPYSRKHENEADELGLYFMAMAGYNPEHAVSFWERMMAMNSASPPEFLSTHPATQTRIDNLKAIMPKAMTYYNESRR